MKVEIWSDVMCPFCYIGKRKFENALTEFKHDKIEIEWKSFQLMPNLKTRPDRNLDKFLSEEKGISLEQAASMNTQVTQMAKTVGLNFDFDKAIPANTFKAHLFLHFAKAQRKQNEAEEILFKAYFTKGKNIDEISVLLELGKELGLNTEELKTDLESEQYAEAVRFDIYEAQQIGVRGVPFFVLDRKYAVSGAQESSTFLEILEKSFKEWEIQNAKSKLEINSGNSCSIDGECD